MLEGCASRRVSEDSGFLSLEFELNRVISRIDRLETKLDMLGWAVSPPFLSRTASEIDSRPEQLEKLVVDLKAQILQLKEQLASRGVQ